MDEEIRKEGLLEQAVAAAEIERRFGPSFVSTSDTGGTAINRDVLAAFRKLNEGKVMWDAPEKAWRLREKHDPRGRRAD